MTNFNKLSPAEEERLAILIEECGEVIKAGCKILRHGYESHNPEVANSESNREALQRELGDLWHALTLMTRIGDLNSDAIADRVMERPEKIAPYLHYQD